IIGGDPIRYTLEFDMSGLRVAHLDDNKDWVLFVGFNTGLRETPLTCEEEARVKNLANDYDVVVGCTLTDRLYERLKCASLEGMRTAIGTVSEEHARSDMRFSTLCGSSYIVLSNT